MLSFFFSNCFAAVELCCCSVNKPNIEEMKRRWVDAGRPQFPEWRQLMAGLVAAEHLTKVQRPQ
jgi:hypothetical protein